MALCDMISRFEAGEPTDADIEHELAGRVIEEIARCKNNPQQVKLFADSRKTADHLLEKYLMLDQDDKAKMAEVYSEDKAFNEIGRIPALKKQKLSKELGENNFNLLRHVLNYSRILEVLETFLRYINESDSIIPRHASLLYFLSNHDANGRKVRENSPNSLYSFAKKDFKRDSSGHVNQEQLFESMTWGVPEELRKRVTDALTLLSVRKRIAENYIRFVTEDGSVNVASGRFSHYISSHNLSSKKVKKGSKKSLINYYAYDFINCRAFEKSVPSDVFESITLGFDEGLKQRLRDTISLVPARIKILEAYIAHVGSGRGISPLNRSLGHYLWNYSLAGKKVKGASSKSLRDFRGYDFKNMQVSCSYDNRSILESMTFGVPDELRKRVIDAQTLLPKRIRILENYVSYINGDTRIFPKITGLQCYMNWHNINGKKVKRKMSPLSVYTFSKYNFALDVQLESPCSAGVFESMTFGVPDELKQRVKDAMVLLPVRERILRNYVAWVENFDGDRPSNITLRRYMLYHDAMGRNVGKKTSLINSFYSYNFRKGKSVKRAKLPDAVNSMCHGIKDENLVAKVRLYSGVAA